MVFAELLLESPLDEQQMRFVRHMLRDCGNMLTLCNTVLAVGRTRVAGLSPLNLEDVALHDLFREVAEGLERRAEASGIGLRILA